MHFSDFKCMGLKYGNTPDVIGKSEQGQLGIIGEIKAPWIIRHKPARAHVDELRNILAQPIRDMHLRCAYGFYSLTKLFSCVGSYWGLGNSIFSGRVRQRNFPTDKSTGGVCQAVFSACCHIHGQASFAHGLSHPQWVNLSCSLVISCILDYIRQNLNAH